MPTAIRINGEAVRIGRRHIDLVREFQQENGFSDDDVDAMIQQGRIEFGSCFLVAGKMEFGTDKTRQSVYSSIDRMIEINGR
jgi:hypothetical protein